MGKHYLVKSTSHPITRGGPSADGEYDDYKGGIKRQYTYTFCMRKDIYDALLKLADDQNDSEALEQVKNTIKDSSDDVYLTIKNYKSESGLSNFIHNASESEQKQIFQVKGPMGIGLGVENHGTHVAFAAGTGVLPFIDLVGHILLQLVDKDYVLEEAGIKTSYDDITIDIDNFNFQLYFSYSNEEEAVCLQLINKVKELCEKLEKPYLLEVHTRMAHSQRWDQEYFEAKIKNKVADGAKKIWVCGPPLMQE